MSKKYIISMLTEADANFPKIKIVPSQSRSIMLEIIKSAA